MFTFKQYITEVLDVKPKVDYVKHETFPFHGDEHEHMGHLGTKNVMHAVGRIKHHLPSHVEILYGNRITGARAKKDHGSYGDISLKHVKPIPPDNE